MNLNVLGIDLAWKYSPERSCLTVYNGRGLRYYFLTTDEEIVEKIRENRGPVGIDAPLLVKNNTGRRRAEKSLHEDGLIAFPSSREFLIRKFGCVRGEILVKKLEKIGYELTTEQKENGIYEVYPCASIKRLLGLRRLPKYKIGSKSKRWYEIRELHKNIIEILGIEFALPNEIDKACDLIDSCFASYTVYLHMKFRSKIYGNLKEGFVVVPQNYTAKYKREKHYQHDA